MCAAVLLSVALGVAAEASLPAFTNHAGHAVRGWPVAVTNGSVRLTRDGTNVWAVPLAAFPATEQARLRKAAGVSAPAEQATTHLRREAFRRDMRLRREVLRKARESSERGGGLAR